MNKILMLMLLSAYFVNSLSKTSCTGKYKGSFFSYDTDHNIKPPRIDFCEKSRKHATREIIYDYLNYMQDKEILLPLLKYARIVVIDEIPCEISVNDILIEKSKLTNREEVLRTIHAGLTRVSAQLSVTCEYNNLRMK